MNFRTDILSRGIFSGYGKFFLEFRRAVWIKFEEQTFCIFQCYLIRTWNWIIIASKRVDRADEVKWRLRICDTPNTTFWQRLGAMSRGSQKRATEQHN